MNETPADEALVYSLILNLADDRFALHLIRAERGECLIEMTPERFVTGKPETYDGVCLTHGVVADFAHHLNMNPGASTD